MPLNRRGFLQESAAGAALAALTTAQLRAAEAPNQKIVVGVMGTNGRGTSLAKRFAEMPGTEVAYVCDVDQRNVARCASAVNEIAGKAPQAIGDFRKILDDKHVDVLVIGAPDHWHGPATILGCSAGKHVYCEKPACHNPQEGEWMIEAARKNKRCVQLGTQRRSMPATREAIEKLHQGAIGDVLEARCWYFNPRPSIGRMKLGTPPAWLDYALWQGPAPARPYREFPTIADNPFHYHWHWFWHWGTAELGNNGVHTVDVCRWGLGVDYPQRVSFAGGRYRYQDDQQTPDTDIASFDFGGKLITWEARSWSSRRSSDPDHEIAFFGTAGSMTIGGGGYKLYDPQGKLVTNQPGNTSDAPHVQNFLAGIREGTKLNAEIEEGFKSTLLCLLGNIAYRTGQTLSIDPATHKIAGNPAAMQFWRREYQSGWEPKV